MVKSSVPKSSHSALAYWNEALENLSKKLYNHAMLDFRKSIQIDSQYLNQARVLFEEYARKEQKDRSIAIGLVILGFKPDDIELMNQIGNYYRDLGMFTKASGMFRQALKVNPRYKFAKYNLAACAFKLSTRNEELIKQTQHVQSFQRLRKVGFQLQYEDKVPIVYNEELSTISVPASPGTEEIDIPDIELWLPKFETKVNTTPESWEAHFDLALLNDIGLFGELAIQGYQKAAELNPVNSDIQNNLAVALANYKNDWIQAKDILLKVLKLHPMYRYGVLNLAITYRQLKKSYSSLKYFIYLGELLQRSQGLFDLHSVVNQANQFFVGEQYTQAEKLYSMLNKEYPKAEWSYRLGIIAMKSHQTQKAVYYWKETLKQDPRHEGAYKQIEQQATQLENEAMDLIKDNFLLDAAETLEEAVHLLPNVRMYKLLAEVYEELDEKEKAENTLNIIENKKDRELAKL